MDEEEWPVDPGAVVVSDAPTEGLVTAPVDDETRSATFGVVEPDGDAAARDIAHGEGSDEIEDAEVIALGPTARAGDEGADGEGEGGDDADPVADADPAVSSDDVAPSDEAFTAGPATAAHGSLPSRPNRSTAVLAVVVILLSTIYGRELVGQRNSARDEARNANETVAALRDEIGALRADVADATKDADDPIQNVFVDRDADRRADALDDVLGDRAHRVRSCVASQLADVLDGDAPQIPTGPLDAQVAATMDWVEMSRGLVFSTRPRVRFVAPAEFASTHDSAAASTIATLDDELYRALGALPPDETIASATHAALGRATVGAFDAERDEIVVAVESPGEPLPPLALVALAHEVEHALADDRIGIDAAALDAPSAVTDDASLARIALFEGDATLTMTRFEVGALDPISLLAALDGGSFHDTEQRLDNAPHVVRSALLFPYTDGLALACELERDGGNAAIDGAYDRPPASTAQVLWPERYTIDEQATDIRDLHGPGDRWGEVRRTAIGAATLRALFEAPGDEPSRALSDPLSRASAWAGSEVVQWTRGDDAAIGIAFAEHHDADGPTLCTSMIDWYGAAFANERIEPATDGMVAFGNGRTTVIRCANNTVRIGIAPDAESAAAITR